MSDSPRDIAYDTDLDLAKRVIEDALARVEGIVASPAAESFTALLFGLPEVGTTVTTTPEPRDLVGRSSRSFSERAERPDARSSRTVCM